MQKIETVIAHCQVADILTIKAGAEGHQVIADLTEYLKPFAAPIYPDGVPPAEDDFAGLRGPQCLKCKKPLSGLLGTFQWGIAHGEGRCANCGWPARAYHYIKLSDGTELTTGGRLYPTFSAYHFCYLGDEEIQTEVAS